MDGGNFPVDLLLFGMVAAFLILRLRSILGRRTGLERPRQPPRPTGSSDQAQPDPASGVTGLRRSATVLELRPEPVSRSRAVPEPQTVTGQTLAQMTALDRNFDPAHFLAGAEAAFRMIVGSFAQGDRVALRPLLADETYAGFEQAIAAREAAGETQRSEIRAVQQAEINEAVLNGTHAAITVRFVSDQVAETLDRDAKPVAGTDAVTEIIDLWTFERTLTVADPAWKLTGTRSG